MRNLTELWSTEEIKRRIAEIDKELDKYRKERDKIDELERRLQSAKHLVPGEEKRVIERNLAKISLMRKKLAAKQSHLGALRNEKRVLHTIWKAKTRKKGRRKKSLGVRRSKRR